MRLSPRAVQLGIALTSLIAGCAIVDRTAPLSPIFLDGVPVENKIERVPFDHAWAAEHGIAGKFDSIFVKPVRYDLLPPNMWENSQGFEISSADEFNTSVRELAAFFDTCLQEERKRVTKNHRRLAVVQSLSPNAVSLDIALTEVIFSRPVAHAVGVVAPVPGSGLVLSAMHQPTVAFAARFTSADGRTLLGTVADRRLPPVRIVDLNKFTVTSSAREIVSQWARELAEAIEFDRLKSVEESPGFSLLPW